MKAVLVFGGTVAVDHKRLMHFFRYPDAYHMGMALAPVPDLTLYDTIYQERYSGLLPESAERYKETRQLHTPRIWKVTYC